MGGREREKIWGENTKDDRKKKEHNSGMIGLETVSKEVGSGPAR